MRQTLLIALAALVFAAAGALTYLWRSGAFEDGPDPVAGGRQLLAASLKGVDGAPQTLEQWRGKVLVVNFWATWCTPCREEIPEFIKLQAQYAANGLQIAGIAIDSPERVAAYAKEMGINYPLLVGGIETMDLARDLGDRAGVLPYSVVIDRSGRVAGVVVGILRPERFEKLVLPLL